MNYVEQQGNRTKYIIVGVIVAVLIHVVAIWALMNGLGSKLVQHFNPPIKTKIIRETSPPSPPPPPPKLTSPPPPYVPPPRIQIQPPPQKQAIKEVTHVKPPTPQPPVAQIDRNARAAGDHSAGASPINGARPEYPDEMREEGREGRVVATCDINPDGRPANCHISHSSGGPAFVEAAEDFLHRVKYAPAVVNGVAVIEHHHVINIDFALDE
ncbi:MAG: energy transducer TonB [Acetobacteraceae bacterium]